MVVSAAGSSRCWTRRLIPSLTRGHATRCSTKRICRAVEAGCRTPWEKSDAVAAIVPLLALIPDAVERSEYVRRLALAVDVEPDAVEQALRKARRGGEPEAREAELPDLDPSVPDRVEGTKKDEAAEPVKEEPVKKEVKDEPVKDEPVKDEVKEEEPKEETDEVKEEPKAEEPKPNVRQAPETIVVEDTLLVEIQFSAMTKEQITELIVHASRALGAKRD